MTLYGDNDRDIIYVTMTPYLDLTGEGLPPRPLTRGLRSGASWRRRRATAWVSGTTGVGLSKTIPAAVGTSTDTVRLSLYQ